MPRTVLEEDSELEQYGGGSSSAAPRLMVIYHGLLASGIALVAYSDGSVALEDSLAASASQHRRLHRREHFGSLERAAAALALPLALAAYGEVRLQADPRACSPTYQVVTFSRPHAAAVGGDSGGTVTWVRHGLAPDCPAGAAAAFRSFAARVAAHERRYLRGARPLSARLGLSDEAFTYVASLSKAVALTERLRLLGLVGGDDGNTSDEELRADVRRAAADIRAEVGAGPLSVSVLEAVLDRKAQGQGDGSVVSECTIDLTGWEQAAAGDSGLAMLGAWLAERVQRSVVHL